MCTHNIWFEQNYEKSQKKKSTENCHFYSHEKSLYIAWACFRYVIALGSNLSRSTCETSQCLLVGAHTWFSLGSPVFAPPND